MNTFKMNLHTWITAAAMTAFMTGWGFLAHAPKPALIQTPSTTITQTVTSSSPLQVIENLFNIRPSHTRTHRSNSNSSPTLRTGGS
jgi:hypothetical protein